MSRIELIANERSHHGEGNRSASKETLKTRAKRRTVGLRCLIPINPLLGVEQQATGDSLQRCRGGAEKIEEEQPRICYGDGAGALQGVSRTAVGRRAGDDTRRGETSGGSGRGGYQQCRRMDAVQAVAAEPEEPPVILYDAMVTCDG